MQPLLDLGVSDLFVEFTFQSMKGDGKIFWPNSGDCLKVHQFRVGGRRYCSKPVGGTDCVISMRFKFEARQQHSPIAMLQGGVRFG